MTDEGVRTYTVGDATDEYVHVDELGGWCGEKDPASTGYVCSVKAGHEGPQHVAANRFRVVAVWAREGTAEPVPEAPAEAIVEVPDVESLRSEVQALKAAVESAQGTLFTERNLRWQAQQALTDFRTLVRDTAIEYAEQYDWCEVVDRALEAMGLDPRQRTYRVGTTITIQRYIHVDVEATSVDEAWRAVDNMGESELREALENYDSDDVDDLFSSGWDLSGLDSSTTDVEEQ